MLPYSGSLVQGSAPPNPADNSSLLENLNTFFTDVKNVVASIDVGAVWDNVTQFFDNSVQFIGNVANQLVTNPLGLLQDVAQGVRDATVVLVNTFTFGGIPALNAEATQLVKNNGGFLRALQVVGTFARELGITYLTMGVGRLATQVGVNTLGRVATGLGLSQAAQTQLLCRLYTIDRLMAPLRAYEQLNSLATNFNRARLAAQRGDYEGAAALLGRSVLTVPAAFNSLRETTRLGAGVVDLTLNGNPQALNDYLQACFAAGTPILGEHGEKPVEEFQPGDRVWCRDEKNSDGFVELSPIEEVFSSANPIWHVHVGGQVIRTTAEHPFWVVGKGWTPARELQPGQLLLSHDGQTQPVEEVLETGLWEKVYNFRVAEHHTYFVGRADWGFSVWAHNANLCFQVVRRTGLQAPNQNIVVTNAQGQRIQVWGEPQHVFLGNGTETDHAQRILQALPDLARTAPDGSYFVLNRSWRTATNRLFESANRPDIILVSPLANGKFKISAWEVRSTNDPENLIERLFEGWESFGGDWTQIQQGRLRVVGE